MFKHDDYEGLETQTLEEIDSKEPDDNINVRIGQCSSKLQDANQSEIRFRKRCSK